MHVHPIVHIILGLIAIITVPGLAIRFITRQRGLPPPAPESTALPPGPLAPTLPRVPSLVERMESVGIPTAALYEGMGSYGIEIESVKSSDGRWSWHPFASYSPEWLDRLFAVSVEDVRIGEKRVPPSAYCDHCDDVMGMAFYEVVKKPVPPGDLDHGWTEPRSLGRWCRRCGLLQQENRAESRVLGALWTESANMHQLVHALESDDAKRKIREAKLACLEAELADVEGRRDRLMHERMRLRDELGLLRGHPNRDRFPAAKLDDPPDDRAKAMPALTSD